MAQYRGAVQVGPAAQALAIAESGISDVQAKLNKDPDFPPPGQGIRANPLIPIPRIFYDMDGATVLGSYTIAVDSSLMTDPAGTNPYGILRMVSTGVFGRSDKPIAQHGIYAEIDAASLLRDGSGNPNPNRFKIVNYQDLGSP